MLKGTGVSAGITPRRLKKRRRCCGMSSSGTVSRPPPSLPPPLLFTLCMAANRPGLCSSNEPLAPDCIAASSLL